MRSSAAFGATQADVAAVLAEELKASEPQLLASLSRRIGDMPPKACRWVAGMREIRQFVDSRTSA